MSAELVSFLTSILPRLLRRLRADVLVEPVNRRPEWFDVLALRESAGQMTALGTVVNHPDMTMQALAKSMSITPSTASTTVRKLVQLGYLRRQANEDDGRVVTVVATDHGRRVFEYYQELRHAAMQARIEQLSGAEQSALEAAIPALSRLLDQG